MNFLSSKFLDVNTKIRRAAEAAGRDPKEITLIGASKTQSAKTISDAYAAGLRHVGENYLDEAIAKRAQFQASDLVWHFIGRVQSNKTRLIATHFDWVHTVDREKIASRLSKHRSGPALNVLIQVNIDADQAKAGVLPDEARGLVDFVSTLPNLRLRGLMTILSQTSTPESSYQSVAQLAARLKATLPSVQREAWDTLSMGMSGDLDAAIAAGATHVRIGTALFGPRSPRADADD